MTWVFEYIVDKIITSFKLMLSLTFDIYGFEVSILSLNLALLVCFALIRFMIFGLPRNADGVSGRLRHKNSENARDKRRQKNEK